jgi:hypothetical protein
VDDEIDCAVGHHNGAQPLKRWDERHLARLGAAQDGVVRLDELAALGLSKRARARRIAQKRLVVMHRGVYAVGHGHVSERGRMRAAVWAAGEGAALSHLAAARLLGLWERGVERVDVTVLLPRCPRVPAPTPMLEPVFERAERKRWIRPEVIEQLAHNRPGADALRHLLATHRPQSGPTRSVLERRMLSALRSSGVPEPIVNGLLNLDGTIFEPDFRLAIRHGWTPLRGTWHDDPAELVRDIRAALRE